MDAWSRISRAAVAAPERVLWVAAAVLLALAPGLTRLTIQTDGLALVPVHAPEVETDRAMRERFAFADQIAVVVRTDDPRGIYNPTTVRRIKEISDTLEAIPGLAGRVTSLATERSDRVYVGTMTFQPWLDPLPTDAEALARLRRDLDAAQVYTGTLIAADPATSAAAILVDVDRDRERGRLYHTIREALADRGDADDEVLIVGAPVAESQLGDHLLADLGTLIPLAMAVLVVVFYAAFRSWTLVALPLAEVGAALLITFALMGWCGVPVYLTMAVLPVILTMIGVTDELHLFTHLLPALASDSDGPQPRAVVAVMDEMAAPVSKASLTTAAGFLSFAASGIEPVRAFGIFMAIGVVVCMLISLTCVPAALALAPARRLRPAAGAGMLLPAPRWWRAEALGRWVMRRRNPILVAALLLLVVAPLGIFRLRVQDSWVDGFAPRSDFRRATDEVDRLFGGTHVLRVAVETTAVDARGTVAPDALGASSLIVPGRITEPLGVLTDDELTLDVVADDVPGRSAPSSWKARIVAAEMVGGDTRLELAPARGPSLQQWLPRLARRVHYAIDADGRLLQPAVLERLGDFERFLAAQMGIGVGRVLGPWEHLATMHFMLHDRREGERRIPADPESMARTIEHYRRVRGERKLREVFDPSFRAALATVFLRHANFADTARLMSAVREYERRELAPRGLTVRFAGDIAASQAMIEAIVGTQVSSVALSLVAITALMSWLFSSLAWGLACILPAGLGVLGMFAAMGWVGMPLGVATSMFAATVLCIGDDYAIHLVEAARRARLAGRDFRDAVVDAVATTAPAVLIDAVAVGAAFGVLCFSRVPPNARLGGLLVVSILVCLVTTLAVLPAFLGWIGPRFLSRAGDRPADGTGT